MSSRPRALINLQRISINIPCNIYLLSICYFIAFIYIIRRNISTLLHVSHTLVNQEDSTREFWIPARDNTTTGEKLCLHPGSEVARPAAIKESHRVSSISYYYILFCNSLQVPLSEFFIVFIIR